MSQLHSNLARGKNYPYLVYSSYDPVAAKAATQFKEIYGDENCFDVFDYPEIVSTRGLPKLNRSPSLVYFNGPKSDDGLWTVLDIPSQIFNFLERVHSVRNGTK